MTSHLAAARQRTLQLRASVSGTGLHSGRPVRITILPAPVGSGITFVRTDLPHVVEVPARAEFVVDTTLNTTLGRDGVRIGTVEHLLAALYGMRVDNARVEVDGPEVPILDGSAHPFVKLIETAGTREQKAPRRVAVIRKPITVTDGDKEVRLTPASTFSVHCTIDFRHPLITDQKLGVDLSVRNFTREIARARTFGFARDVELLRSRGLALGGSLDNAIVIDEFHILNPEGLRYPDEFVRHKILDAMGDLALLGMPIIGALHARKPGHALNHKLVKRLQNDPSHVEIVTLGEPVTGRASASSVEMPLAAAMEGSLA